MKLDQENNAVNPDNYVDNDNNFPETKKGHKKTSPKR